MYLDYFSLKRHPFRITPDPSLFFPGGAHGRGVVLDALVYAITTGEGILKVVGEVGSGKTMLCRMLEERLPDSVEIVYLANPNLSARDIIYAIAFELKLDVDASTDRLIVMQKLQNYLLQRHSAGASVVVFIEEAQGMPLETLEEVRLLSNLETHRHKLMQIVLFGQPELDRKLQDKSIRQLRERITHSFNLEPLTLNEVREYLHFRLQTAGCPWPQLFSPKSEQMLARASEGLTRRINILADKALLASYADPATRPDARSSSGEILPMVLPRHVKTAIADCAYGSKSFAKYLPYSGYAVALVALSLLVFVLVKYVWIGEPDDKNAATGGVATLATGTATESSSREPGPDGSTRTATLAGAQISTAENPLAEPAATLDETASRNNGTAEPLGPRDADLSADPAGENENPVVMGEPQRVAFAADAGVRAAVSQPTDNTSATIVIANEEASIEHTSPVSETLAEPSPDTTEAFPVTASDPATTPEVDTRPASHYTFTGLAATRFQPSREWLAGLANKVGYTIQMFSVLTRQPEMLQEFLVLLDDNEMLDQVFLCVISGNDSRAEQWLVLYNEFNGVSEAQKRIESFAANISQYMPYARNLNDIEGAN
jgi:MSHA biogenesis protein MshM